MGSRDRRRSLAFFVGVLESDFAERRHRLAQAIVLICDQCGKPDASTISIRAGARNFVKDLCSEHLRALLKDTRAPRRGRPKVGTSSGAAPEAAGRKRRAAKKPATRKRVAKKTSARKASRTTPAR